MGVVLNPNAQSWEIFTSAITWATWDTVCAVQQESLVHYAVVIDVMAMGIVLVVCVTPMVTATIT